MIRLSKDPLIGWELRPNALDHNSSAMRDIEYSFLKEKGLYRIAVIGDSVTYGLGVEKNQVYTEVLENEINKNNSERVEVLNFGVPGYNAFQDYMTVKSKVLKFNPDCVIMTFTADDVEKSPVVIWVEGEFCLFTNYMEGTPFYVNSVHWSLFRASSLYRLIYKSLIVFLLSTKNNTLSDPHIDPVSSWKAVRLIERLCNKEGILFFLVISPSLAQGEPEYLKALSKIRQFAERDRVKIVDLGPLYEKNSPKLNISGEDFEHPNALGHRLIAEQIENFLKRNILRK